MCQKNIPIRSGFICLRTVRYLFYLRTGDRALTMLIPNSTFYPLKKNKKLIILSIKKTNTNIYQIFLITKTTHHSEKIT
jgi:hypothetical protein